MSADRVAAINPLSTIRTRYGNSVSTPGATRTGKNQQNSLQKGSRYGISVSTLHRRYGRHFCGRHFCGRHFRDSYKPWSLQKGVDSVCKPEIHTKHLVPNLCRIPKDQPQLRVVNLQSAEPNCRENPLNSVVRKATGNVRTVSNATLGGRHLSVLNLNSILFPMVGAPAKNKLHSH